MNKTTANYLKDYGDDYRPEIDGLRMIAVLSVIIYHIWPTALPGGFLGVDIFLVISGYLITGIIIRESNQKRFSFSRFYLRRVKRIIPAQIIVILVTLLVFFYLMTPDEFADLGQSSFYSAFSVANIYFWLESGYFGALNEFAPLLHMWSLGVEEQFYIFWPALMIVAAALGGHSGRAIALAGAFLVSFGAAVWAQLNYPSAAFYLFPFRAFEFVVGGCFAVIAAPRLSPLVSGLVAIASAAALAGCFFLFTSDVAHPSVYTLIPCISTALLIHVTRTDPISRGVLAFRPFVHVGLLSYVLYLVHWPVLTAARVITVDEIPLHFGLVLIFLIYLLAGALHVAWEKPMRYGKWGDFSLEKAQLWIIVISFAGLTFLSAHVWASQPASVRETQEDPLEEIAAVAHGFCTPQIETPADLQDCRTDILVIGDSHAGVFVRAIVEALRTGGLDAHVARWTMPGCPPIFGVQKIYNAPNLKPREQECRALQQAWESTIPDSDVTVIVLAARWAWLTEPGAYLSDQIREDALVRTVGDSVNFDRSRELLAESLPTTVKALTDSGKGVVLVPQVPVALSRTLRCAERDRAQNVNKSCKVVPSEVAESRTRFSTEVLRRAAVGNTRVHLVDTHKPFCQAGGNCVIASESGEILYKDETHLGPAGQSLLAEAMAPEFNAFVGRMIEPNQ